MESTIQDSKFQEKSKLGRPFGSTAYTRELFLKDAIAIYAKLFRPDFERPKQAEVAAELGIVRHTIMRYLKRYEISWAQIHSQALEGANKDENNS